jgi:hypothetical protein
VNCDKDFKVDKNPHVGDGLEEKRLNEEPACRQAGVPFSKESEREIFGVAQGPVLRYAARDGVIKIPV